MLDKKFLKQSNEPSNKVEADTGLVSEPPAGRHRNW